MIDRTTKLRWRRRYRKGKRQVEDIGVQAEERLEKHFIRRFSRLWEVKRFLIAWVLLIVLLCGGLVMQTRALSPYYQKLEAVPGGTYTEGILGSFTDANPLYAAGSVDSAVSRLVFSGLFKYDVNNHLLGDLANTYKTDDSGKVYTVTLKPNLKWQDGKPLDADDVVFTYKVIQNPDAKSTLFNSWQGIDVKALNSQTIQFTLPSPLVSFPDSMVNGIIPKHLLDGVPTAQLRSVNFNTVHPIGSGPFKWETLEVSGTTPEQREERIALLPNEYYVNGTPKLSRFVVRAFHDEKQMVTSFDNQEINGMAGLDEVPDELAKASDVQQYDMPLTSEVMVFLKTSQDILSDSKVRQAIVRGTDVQNIIKNLPYPAIAAKEPLLENMLGYDRDLQEVGFAPDEANKILDDDGWKVGKDGIRVKDGRPLSFRLSSASTSEYAFVSQMLQKQWRAIGVDAQVFLQPDADLQSAIAFHTYDSLLYGISLGTDPDVFPYWHSSQADIRSATRLNFAEYRSKVADTALEAGRSRTDPLLRAAKYHTFLQAWRDDAPAIGLYQPRFLYFTRGPVANFSTFTINTGPDRYANVQNWMIHQAKTNK